MPSESGAPSVSVDSTSRDDGIDGSKTQEARAALLLQLRRDLAPQVNEPVVNARLHPARAWIDLGIPAGDDVLTDICSEFQVSSTK